VQLKKELIATHSEDKTKQYDDLKQNCSNEEFQQITEKIEEQCEQAIISQRTLITKKLNKLYHGSVLFPSDHDNFINLSNHNVTEVQREVLNMGLNCHLQPKFDIITKKVEMEILYDSISQLVDDGKITINQNLKEELRSEATKQRSQKCSNVLSKQQWQAAKEIRHIQDLIIRKADKANIYVLMNKQDYINKLDVILSDQTKFKKISTDPTKQLKINVNKLIDTANAVIDGVKLKRIIGEYEPGYIYGNAKIHKPDIPL
jgi:membrane-bound lytic murein transglycosylase